MGLWLRSAPGRYLLDWELGRLDHAVTDAFGFHALQLGLPQIEALRANRMPHRWVAHAVPGVPEPLSAGARPDIPPDTGISVLAPEPPVALACDFGALPFPAGSIDLVVLPHALEFAPDPHQLLREAERVLRPEGRIVITGFNPASLWGLRQRLRSPRLGSAGGGESAGGEPIGGFVGEFVGYWRLRDWLRLLGFEIESGQFGCWRPPLNNARWLERWRWMDDAGERWWPVLGAAYVLVAVKRVRGMRLVGLLPKAKTRAARAPVAVAQRRPLPRQAPVRRIDNTLKNTPNDTTDDDT